MRPLILIAVVAVAWCAGRWLRDANRKSLEAERREGLPNPRDLPSSVRLEIGQKLVGLGLAIAFPYLAWVMLIVGKDPDLKHTPAWLIGIAFLVTMTVATIVVNIVRKRLLRGAGENYKLQLALGPVPDAGGRRAFLHTAAFIAGVMVLCVGLGIVLYGQLASSGAPSGAADSSSLTEPVDQPILESPSRVALTVPTTRASSIPPAPLNVQVYFVPIGNLAFVDIPYLVSYYQQRFGLTITPLPAVAPGRTFNPRRRQFQAEGLIRSIETGYPAIANDGRSILIGITEGDLYTAGENWRFALGLRGQDRLAVVSSARMDLVHFVSRTPMDTAVLHRRLIKMISRDIGFLYYGLPFSRNPRSVVRSSIMGVDELDELGEDF